MSDYEDQYVDDFRVVRSMFRLNKPPAGVLADLVEFEGYYTIRLYRDNFDKLTPMTKHAAADWAGKTIESIKLVADCYLEVWKGPGVPE